MEASKSVSAENDIYDGDIDSRARWWLKSFLDGWQDRDSRERHTYTLIDTLFTGKCFARLTFNTSLIVLISRVWYSFPSVKVFNIGRNFLWQGNLVAQKVSKHRSQNLKHSGTSRAFDTGAHVSNFRRVVLPSVTVILTTRADKDVSNPRREEGSLKSLGERPIPVLLHPISRLPRKQPSKRYLFPIGTLGTVRPPSSREGTKTECTARRKDLIYWNRREQTRLKVPVLFNSHRRRIYRNELPPEGDVANNIVVHFEEKGSICMFAAHFIPPERLI